MKYVGPNGLWYQFKSFKDAKEYILSSWKKNKRESRYKFKVKDLDYGVMNLEIVKIEDDKNPRIRLVERKTFHGSNCWIEHKIKKRILIG